MDQDKIYLLVTRYLKGLGYPEESFKRDVRRNDGKVVDLQVELLGEVKILVEFKERIPPYNNNFPKNKDYVTKVLMSESAQNIEYALVTNGVDHNWYQRDEEELVWIREVEVDRFVDKDITTINDKIFTFLSSKRQEEPNLFFKLQPKLDKLEKGFWFPGSKVGRCDITFWYGTNWVLKRDNIFLRVTDSGAMGLVFSAEDSEGKAKFLKQLANVLGGFQQLKKEGKLTNRWVKRQYKGWQKDYLVVLEDFLTKEKQIIDTYIQNQIIKKQDLGISFIAEKDFQKQLNQVEHYRKQAKIKTSIKTPEASDNPIIIPGMLSLKNIGRFEFLELDLSPRIVCILGENGIGKTTILRAFILAITGANETTMVDLSNVKLQRLLRIENEENGAINFAKQGEIKLDYHLPEPYLNKVVLTYKKERRMVDISDDYAEDKKSFGVTYDKNLYKNLIIGYSQVQGKKNDSQKTEINSFKKPNVNDVLPLLYDEEDDRFSQLSDWLIGLEGDAQRKGEQSGERKVRDIVFEVISEITETTIAFKDVNHKDRLLWVSVDDSQVILFSLLSQGYKNLFAWVGHFIKRLAEANDYSGDFWKAAAIVLIDEIATFLHPKWQRNILNVLAKKFINTRFIITTHSPIVATHLSVESKALYIINGDGTVTKEKHIYGRHLKNVFYDWMGVVPRPLEIQNKIDQLFLLIDEETPDSLKSAKELMAELEEDLGDDDGDMLQAKTVINFFEG